MAMVPTTISLGWIKCKANREPGHMHLIVHTYLLHSHSSQSYTTKLQVICVVHEIRPNGYYDSHFWS